MNYAVMIGSNMFLNTTGVLSVEMNGKMKEFLNIREIFKARSEGSYITLDCDIKDNQKQREVKLFKSKPVALHPSVSVESSGDLLIAKRSDGTIIIKVEILNTDDQSLPKEGFIGEVLSSGYLESLIRITGDFYAGDIRVYADNELMEVGGLTAIRSLFEETGGIKLTSAGFSI